MMQRRSLAYAVLIMVVALFVGGGLTSSIRRCSAPPASSYAETPRPPLDGARTHDFGRVPLDTGGAQVTHVFSLRNTTMVPIRVTDISTTCGCSDAQVDRDSIAPGDTLRVTGTLNVSDSGAESAQIIIRTDHDDADPLALTLRAMGRRTRSMTFGRSHIDIVPDQPSTVHVYALDYDRDDAPPSPNVVAPYGITVAFDGWIPIETRRPEFGLPARWETVLSISAAPRSIDHGRIERVHLELPGLPRQTITVQMTSREPATRGG